MAVNGTSRSSNSSASRSSSTRSTSSSSRANTASRATKSPGMHFPSGFEPKLNALKGTKGNTTTRSTGDHKTSGPPVQSPDLTSRFRKGTTTTSVRGVVDPKTIHHARFRDTFVNVRDFPGKPGDKGNTTTRVAWPR